MLINLTPFHVRDRYTGFVDCKLPVESRDHYPVLIRQGYFETGSILVYFEGWNTYRAVWVKWHQSSEANAGPPVHLVRCGGFVHAYKALKEHARRLNPHRTSVIKSWLDYCQANP
jgi:hypothetical protein